MVSIRHGYHRDSHRNALRMRTWTGSGRRGGGERRRENSVGVTCVLITLMIVLEVYLNINNFLPCRTSQLHRLIYSIHSLKRLLYAVMPV